MVLSVFRRFKPSQHIDETKFFVSFLKSRTINKDSSVFLQKPLSVSDSTPFFIFHTRRYQIVFQAFDLMWTERRYFTSPPAISTSLRARGIHSLHYSAQKLRCFPHPPPTEHQCSVMNNPPIFLHWHGLSKFQTFRLNRSVQRYFGWPDFLCRLSYFLAFLSLLIKWWNFRLCVSTFDRAGKWPLFNRCSVMCLQAQGNVFPSRSPLRRYASLRTQSEGIITRAPPSVTRLFALPAFSDTSLIKWSRFRLNRWTNRRVNKPTKCANDPMSAVTLDPFSWWSDRF